MDGQLGKEFSIGKSSSSGVRRPCRCFGDLLSCSPDQGRGLVVPQPFAILPMGASDATAVAVMVELKVCGAHTAIE